MSIIPHLSMLVLAAVLSSSIHQYQIDLKMTSPDGIQRINQLWLVTYINEAGREIVAQAKVTTGEYVPLIAADPARLESTDMGAARGLANVKYLKMRLIKLSNIAYRLRTSRHEHPRAAGRSSFNIIFRASERSSDASRASFWHCYQEALAIIEEKEPVVLALARALIDHPGSGPSAAKRSMR